MNSKKDLVAKIGKQWADFQQVQQSLSEDLLTTQSHVQEVVFAADTCPQLAGAIKELDVIWETHNATRGVKDNLSTEGRKLMAEDEKNVTTIQNILGSIDSNWDKVNEIIKDQRALLSEINAAWNQFGQARQKFYTGIQPAQQAVKVVEEISNDAMQATQSYDKSKKALDALKKSKGFMDLMNNKAHTILKQAEGMENFDVSDINKELATANEAYQQAQDALSQKVQSAEAQMVIWKQIDEAKNELLQWLGETNAALTDAAENVTDTEMGQIRLAAYKNDLESKQNLRASIQAKTVQLLKLNKVESIPTLASLNKLLDDEFADLNDIANKLEDKTKSFGQDEKKVKEDIKRVGDKVGKIREKLIKCDNLTGENSKILERLKSCQSLKSEINYLNSDMDNINKCVDEIKKNFPSFAESVIVKELGGLNKRYAGVVSHANKIEKTLITFLVKCHREKLAGLQRNISTYKEKLIWCQPEPSSDRYNLEAKISSLQDVHVGLKDCDVKKNELGDSLNMLTEVGGEVNIQELKDERDSVEKELSALNNNYAETKAELEGSVGLWKKYEEKSENVSAWLREIEGQVRAHGGTQTDLSTVKEKIKEMVEFKSQIAKMEPELTEVENLGELMLKQSPDARVGHYVSQLVARFQAITKFVEGYVDRLQALNKNQELYNDAVKKADVWLVDADKTLAKFDEALKAGAKPSLYQTKLEELKAFTEQREAGQVLLNKAVEQGEALFSEITPANRDLVRGQLRGIRDSSEALIDKSNAITKRIEGMLIQRSSFDDSYSQVTKWLGEADKKIGEKLELKPSLQEKKLVLHGYRAIAQDVSSHHAIFKQLQEKIAIISDSEASSRFDGILKCYGDVTKKIEDRVSVSEKHVADHESYLQALEKSRDLLSTLVAEEAKSEKDSADAKLAVIENLLQQKDDGDRLLEICDEKIKVVLQQTDKDGHPGLLSELDEQKNAWNTFIAKCNSTVDKLRQQCSRWTEFEENIEDVTTWLKQKESQVKDQSLRSTQEAKQSHLVKLKSLEEEIGKKTDDIAALQSGSVEAEPELVDKVSKISTRYQALRNQTKVNTICLK